jgi:hypothetical protein
VSTAQDAPGPWPHSYVEGRVLQVDGDDFAVAFHDDWAHFIDPRLAEVLAGWGVAAPEAVPGWRRWSQAGGRVLSVSMDHSWALPAWARAWRAAGPPLTVVHLDRHTDCGAPLLLVDAAGALQDCLTGAPVRLDAPASLEAAVASGAIGIGGFVAPAVAAGAVRGVVHVFPSRTPLAEGRGRTLAVGAGAPHPRRPDLRWLEIGLEGQPVSGTGALRRIPYLAAHVADVPRDLPGPLILDVDLDYASNRLRGEPDWEDTPGPELTDTEFAADLRTVLDAVDPARIACVSVGTSPRFCPSERWRPLLETVSAVLEERLGSSLAGLCPWERER